MSASSSHTHRIAPLLALILAGEAIFFLPFVLVRIFRPTYLEVFQITNLELGVCFSAYGIVAMVSYFFGGPLADRFPARNLMAIALVATGAGGLYLATLPSLTGLFGLYTFWGMTTILLFWAALVRATREWGDVGFQGRAFGLVEGGRGLTAALIGLSGLALFSWLMPSSEESTENLLRQESFQGLVLAISALVILSGALVWWSIPLKSSQTLDPSAFSLKKMTPLLRRGEIWLLALIIVCAYAGYKITDDFSLYAHEVLGFTEIQSAGVGTAALWMRPVFAVLAGFLADRFSARRIISWCFILMLLGGGLTALHLSAAWVPAALFILAISLVGVYGLRGVYFAVMEDANIPLKSTGAAVGLMSVIGYTPDVFMSPLMGYLLDHFPGSEGHRYVFVVLAGFALLGLLSTLYLSNRMQRFRKYE